MDLNPFRFWQSLNIAVVNFIDTRRRAASSHIFPPFSQRVWGLYRRINLFHSVATDYRDATKTKPLVQLFLFICQRSLILISQWEIFCRDCEHVFTFVKCLQPLRSSLFSSGKLTTLQIREQYMSIILLNFSNGIFLSKN